MKRLEKKNLKKVSLKMRKNPMMMKTIEQI